MISSTRYEHGQQPPNEWTNFNKVIKHVASSTRNIIAGNSVYDAEYISYFTGLPTYYIPSFCGHIKARYSHPAPRKEFLLGHSHVSGATDKRYWDTGSLLFPYGMEQIALAKQKFNANNMIFKGITELYSHYEYSDLASHPALIHFPYQVSVMSFFEHYRMNIPLFVPSLDFLVELDIKHYLISERTWDKIYGKGISDHSTIPKDPHFVLHNYDPNDEINKDSVRYWLSKADYYTKPHIQYFDSFEDLIIKLQKADFAKISREMELHNIQFHAQLHAQWSELLTKIFKDRPKEGYRMSNNFDTALKELYGITVD